MQRFVIALAAATVTFFVQPAHAAPGLRADHETRIVRTNDLDLSAPADQEELRQRIDRAARQICTDHGVRIAHPRCVQETIDHAMNLAPWTARHAYAAAIDRQQSFTLAGSTLTRR